MEPPPEPPPPARANASTLAEAKAAWSGFMKQSRTAQAVKKIAKPRGPVPSDEFGLKRWGDIKGEWQSSGPAHGAPAADSNDSGTDNDDGGASASVDGASTAKRRRTQAPRKFQATWKDLLPALFLSQFLPLVRSAQYVKTAQAARLAKRCSSKTAVDTRGGVRARAARGRVAALW